MNQKLKIIPWRPIYKFSPDRLGPGSLEMILICPCLRQIQMNHPSALQSLRNLWHLKKECAVVLREHIFFIQCVRKTFFILYFFFWRYKTLIGESSTLRTFIYTARYNTPCTCNWKKTLLNRHTYLTFPKCWTMLYKKMVKCPLRTTNYQINKALLQEK